MRTGANLLLAGFSDVVGGVDADDEDGSAAATGFARLLLADISIGCGANRACGFWIDS